MLISNLNPLGSRYYGPATILALFLCCFVSAFGSVTPAQAQPYNAAAWGVSEQDLATLLPRRILTKVDVASKIPQLQAAATAGDPYAAMLLGFAHSHAGNGVDVDGQLIFDFFKLSCDRGLQRGCANLGTLYLMGIGTPIEIPRGKQLLETACRAKAGTGCALLGSAHDIGQFGQVNIAAAIAAYRDGCDVGYGAACGYLGQKYMTGTGVGENPRRATELFQIGCDARDADSCGFLGRSYQHGVGISQDQAKANALFERSCDEQSGVGCVGLGINYQHGISVPENRQLALFLFQKGCYLKNPQSCELAARLEASPD